MIKRILPLMLMLLMLVITGFGQTATQIFQQASADYDAKRYQAAADGFARYTQVAPSDSGGFFNLGLSYYGLDRFVDAVAPLKEAIRLKSDYFNAHYYLGLSYYFQENYA